MKTFALILFTLFLGPIPLQAKSPPKKNPALPILKAFQEKWDSIKTYQAHFKQEVSSTQIPGPADLSEGTLFLKRPNLLRWQSDNEANFQILNKKVFTDVHTNALRKVRMVEIYPNASAIFRSKSLTFLTGHEKFEKLYDAELIEQTEKIARIQLTYKEKSKEKYIAEIDKRSYFLTALTTETPDTKIEITFSKIEFNPEIDESRFFFKPEPGDVVQRH